MSGHFLFKEEPSLINGAVFEVHKRLGIGMLEKVYQDALEVEFKLRNIPYEREKRFAVNYKGVTLDSFYIADFFCFDKIIVELKSVTELLDIHKAQVKNYLSLTGAELGLLYNFNEPYITPIRILNPNCI